jgi:hypothetical protein
MFCLSYGCFYFNHLNHIKIEQIALYGNRGNAKYMSLYLQCFVYAVTTCLHFDHVNQIGIDEVVLYCHTIRLYDHTKNICELSSKKWIRIAYNNYIANLMGITIYGNREKSHNYINNISKLSSKNWSEWYIILYIPIIFGQFHANNDI